MLTNRNDRPAYRPHRPCMVMLLLLAARGGGDDTGGAVAPPEVRVPVSVIFGVSACTLTTTTMQTDAQARAVAGSSTPGTVAGPQSITATVASRSAQAIVTAAAGAPTRLALAMSPQARARAGLAITPAVSARARDLCEHRAMNACVRRAGTARSS